MNTNTICVVIFKCVDGNPYADAVTTFEKSPSCIDDVAPASNGSADQCLLHHKVNFNSQNSIIMHVFNLFRIYKQAIDNLTSQAGSLIFRTSHGMLPPVYSTVLAS